MLSTTPLITHASLYGRLFLVIALATLAVALARPACAQAPQARVALTGHIPHAVANATVLGRLDPSTRVSLALLLPLRNQADLDDLLRGLYDPNDPRYGHYLTPAEFTADFGPSEADYLKLEAFARANGLTITGTSANRALLNVEGTSANIEQAFGLNMMQYRAADGRVIFAPDREPSIPANLRGVLSGIVGLDDALVIHPNSRRVWPRTDRSLLLQPSTTGSGTGGGLTPSDVKTAYSLNGISQNGAGQTIGLFEMDDFKQSDITAFESKFGIPNVPINGGGAGIVSTGGQDECTLDIDMALALAPGISAIDVYEGQSNSPNPAQVIASVWNTIATEDAVNELSTSWWYGEGSGTIENAEATAAQEMAAQGESVFSASGDYGAYDTGGSTLAVQDPASDPWFVAVGGTNLTTNGAGGAWVSETSWADPNDTSYAVKGTGGGGGISSYWGIPGYQQTPGVITGASLGSTTMRNVPDVSLYGDYETGGYSICVNGSWIVINGTSAASPLWASFNALVNQARSANHLKPIGLPDPAIYAVAESSHYSSDYHDIADGSNNLYYPAVTGYDLSTGWGTMIGSNLLTDLASYGTGVTMPTAPSNLTATAGDQAVTLSWTASAGSDVTYDVYRSTTSGGEGTTPIAGGISGTTFLNNIGLTNGTTYYYTVSAVNNAGMSGQSNQASAVPMSSLPPPGGFFAAAGNGSVTLYWDTPSGATGYNIYRATTPGGEGSTPYVSNFSYASSYTDSSLTNGTTYYYTIAAIYPSTTSNQSGEISSTPTTSPLQPPSSLTATPGNAQVALSWPAASGALSYNVYRGTEPQYVQGSPIASGLTGTAYTDTSVANGTAYFYRVAAVYSTGTSAMGTTVEATPSVPSAPPTPTGVTASAGNAQATVSWTASSGATSYNVYRSTTSGGEGTTPYASGITTTSYTNTGLTNGTTYYYTVAAVNSVGTSAQSSQVSATPTGLPAAPTGVTATAGSKQIKVAWNAVTGATSYNIYRSTTSGGEGTNPYASGITATSYTNTGLTTGKKYYYKVAAVNSAGTGPQSSEVSATSK